ncbi:MAG: hypothetical protein WC025_00560 [Candidatus Magasanikbacteria bacterium]
METSKSKIFAQFVAGIFGGTILGITGLLTMMNYGGNHGCWAFIDYLFGTAGYESCGSFGSIAGIIIGTILGITVISKVKISNYSKVAIYLLFGAFILPFIYGVIMFWPPFEDGDLLIVPPAILGFIIASIIPSVIITGAINWRKFLGRNK